MADLRIRGLVVSARESYPCRVYTIRLCEPAYENHEMIISTNEFDLGDVLEIIIRKNQVIGPKEPRQDAD